MGRSTWNSKYIGQNIKEWIKSVEISFSPKNPNKVHSKERYKVVRNPETGTLLHLSVTNCSSKQNIGPMWQIAGENLRLGHNQFNDGYFYMTSRHTIYLYPDMETALVGQFRNGTMLSAKVSKVKRERCNHGIKELEIEEPNADSPTFRYTTTSHTHIGDQPTLMDPYERKMIYIDDGVKDDGMFARRNISKGDLLAYYSGLTVNILNTNEGLCPTNQTMAERWECERNLMLLKNSYQNSYAIDVPKSHWDIVKYRATLGHKANHSFKYFNSEYGMAYHPRYGSIRSIVAIRNIIKGEEILVDYLLGSRGDKVPE